MESRRYVICDIEATGLDEAKEIIEIALLTFEDGKLVEVYETLVNPLRPVSEFIQNLTSISSRELQTAPKFYDVAEGLKRRLEGAVFVSHNTEFDLGLLKRKFEERGETLQVKSFCTLKTSQELIPGLKSYTLDALCDFFRIKMRNRHRAIGDAQATLELFKELQSLRLKGPEEKIFFLPQHEKLLKSLPHQAGLLTLKDLEGKVLKRISSAFLDDEARRLLQVKPENKFYLEQVEGIEYESTGSALIAEFKRIFLEPLNVHWMIVVQELPSTEKIFRVKPFRKVDEGLWYFKSYPEARRKLKTLEGELRDKTFIFRDGPRSKEEVVQKNRKVEALSKSQRFPTPHLMIWGHGRTLREKSFIHIKDGHVRGFGYGEDEDKILASPESFYVRRLSRHLACDLAAKHYLRVLKNLRNKQESWRSLAL